MLSIQLVHFLENVLGFPLKALFKLFNLGLKCAHDFLVSARSAGEPDCERQNGDANAWREGYDNETELCLRNPRNGGVVRNIAMEAQDKYGPRRT
jgi:hypothetical protein